MRKLIVVEPIAMGHLLNGKEVTRLSFIRTTSQTGITDIIPVAVCDHHDGENVDLVETAKCKYAGYDFEKGVSKWIS